MKGFRQTNKLIIFIALVINLANQSTPISVNPSLCPTNKIAPHRKVVSQTRPRTLGYFAQLFSDDLQNPGSSGQQEEPQPDDPDDCGDIDDYDENDLSSLTPNSQRKRGYNEAENRLFFHNFFGRPPGHNPDQPGLNPGPGQYPQRPTQRPPNQLSPTRPGPPLFTKPPYYSGGIFQNNPYRPPPYQHTPSNNVKPVYEDSGEPPVVTYRPSIVGGQLNHIVGISPTVRPRPQPGAQPTPRPDFPNQTTGPQNPVRYDPNTSFYRPRPQQQTQSTSRPYPVRYDSNSVYPNRITRPRQMSDSIIGSFLDLLLK